MQSFKYYVDPYLERNNNCKCFSSQNESMIWFLELVSGPHSYTFQFNKSSRSLGSCILKLLTR